MVIRFIKIFTKITFLITTRNFYRDITYIFNHNKKLFTEILLTKLTALYYNLYPKGIVVKSSKTTLLSYTTP